MSDTFINKINNLIRAALPSPEVAEPLCLLLSHLNLAWQARVYHAIKSDPALITEGADFMKTLDERDWRNRPHIILPLLEDLLTKKAWGPHPKPCKVI